MTRVCFVSNEIHPTVPGGAGSLIHNLAQAILDKEHEVIFLLDIPKVAFERFNSSDRLQLPNKDKCRAYQVDAFCTGMPYRQDDFLSRYLWESFRYDYACRQVYDLEKPDLIEFVDFCGPAYCALCAKIAHLSYQHSRLVVRVHGSIGVIDRSAGGKPIDFDRYTIYALEKHALRLAESVHYPTPSFLQDYHSDHGSWLGEAILSPPVLTSFPERQREDPNANIVLFAGRLFSVKGVDVFVDAALEALREDPKSSMEFYLVGYDSMEPPAKGVRSYREYLLQRIPKVSRNRFHFTGSLSRPRLEEILPRVRFAIFPSYYETYCFSAHELRRAGIPLIVSDIPAFRDAFRPGKDALFFDGSVNDLTRQIQHLQEEESLRKMLSQPYSLVQEDGIKFYLNYSPSSWIATLPSSIQSSILVCIIIENETEDDQVAQTMASLKDAIVEDMRIILLKSRKGEEVSTSGAWLFGGLYEFYDLEGRPISCFAVRTSQTLLILRAGDELALEYIPRCMDIIARQPQVAYVGSWKWIKHGKRKWLQTHPLAAMAELAPFESMSFFNRCVMRTPVGISFIDLFDRRADRLAEVAYLWTLDNDRTVGVQIPEPLVSQQAEMVNTIGDAALSYLILQDRSPARHSQLTLYLTMLVNSFSQSLLPIQTYWARKSGFISPTATASDTPIIIRSTWRHRLVKRLRNGGVLSQHILAIMRWIWAKIEILL